MLLFSKQKNERSLRVYISGNSILLSIRDRLNNVIWERATKISHRNNPTTSDLTQLIPKKLREAIVSIESSKDLKIKSEFSVQQINYVECYISNQFITTVTTEIEKIFTAPEFITNTTINDLNKEVLSRQELMNGSDANVLFYDHIANVTLDGYHTSSPTHKSATSISYTLVTAYISKLLLHEILTSLRGTLPHSHTVVLPEFTLCRELLSQVPEQKTAFIIFMGQELIELFETYDGEVILVHSLDIGMNDIVSEIVHLTHFPFSHIKSVLSDNHLYNYFISSNKKNHDRLNSVCLKHKEKYFNSATEITSKKIQAPIFVYSHEVMSDFWLNYLTTITNDTNVSDREITPISIHQRDSLFHSHY
jgi:hypothetical protein